MLKAILVTTVVIGLAGCGGSVQNWPAAYSQSVGVRNRGSDVKLADPNCSSRLEPPIRDKGGKMPIPAIPNSPNFSGYFGYAPVLNNPGTITDVESCSDNSFDIPVPTGYTADWFGWWNVCNGQCAFSFEDGSPKMQIQSTTFLAKTQYYLYVYTTAGGQLIESYTIGTVKKKKSKLLFASPFANGFSWPTNDAVSLEIVHASS